MSQTTKPTPPATPKATMPRRIKLAVNLVIVVSLLGMAAAGHILTSKPTVLTNTTTRIITDDSVIVLREQLAKANAERDAARALAADRAQILSSLASPLQRLTDSSLALQRGAIEGVDAIARRQADNALARDKLEAARLARYNRLMDRVEQVPDRGEMATMLQELQPAVLMMDTPHLGLSAPPAKARWGLQLEPYLEAGFNDHLQPTFRAGGRLWLRKSNTTR